MILRRMCEAGEVVKERVAYTVFGNCHESTLHDLRPCLRDGFEVVVKERGAEDVAVNDQETAGAVCFRLVCLNPDLP